MRAGTIENEKGPRSPGTLRISTGLLSQPAEWDSCGLSPRLLSPNFFLQLLQFLAQRFHFIAHRGHFVAIRSARSR